MSGGDIDGLQRAIQKVIYEVNDVAQLSPEEVIEEAKKKNVIVSSSPILKPEVFPDTAKGRETAKAMYLGKNKVKSGDKEGKKEEEERIGAIVDRADTSIAIESMIADIFEEL